MTKTLTILSLFFGLTLYAKQQLHSCPTSEFVRHRYYTLCYSDYHEQALWTSHLLKKSSIRGKQKRTDDFRFDPKVSSVGKRAYKNSGFDRGHMVPAGDMKLNFQSMSETFYMSNMSPQRPGFNRHTWRKLETLVRQWVLAGRDMRVVTGPVLEYGLPRVNNLVSIPEFHYKIIFDHKNLKEQKMIAFLLPNKYSNNKLSDFATTVDEIEKVTGLNFFVHLPPKLQNKLESQINLKQWKWELKKNHM